ncbi:MAG: hypothetical protein QG636_164 [Patescibacteria group bacterium]|nr:hypothetical protein [Patescibacteria group bacterium]
MIEPDELENQADQEHDRADTHAESEEMLRRQADEQREAQAREEETHD